MNNNNSNYRENILGCEDISVSEAMQLIDRNSYGILFIVDESKRLLSCITDGDIRRWLLAGGKMDDNVHGAANSNPKFAYNTQEAKRLYHKRNYIAVPIVDGNLKIIDIYTGEDSAIKRSYCDINIPVVINAGGKGTRLDPFTKVLPKPLIPVGELPIIELIMQEYQRYRCEDFHIIVNYKRDLIKAYFADADNHYNVTWHDEMKPLGTGGGLSLLRGKFDDTFFFANCDALLISDYKKIVDFHKQNKNVITMVCAYKNLNIPYGVVEMGENGIVEEMKEKPLVSFLTNTGMYVVEPEVIEDIEDDVAIGFPDIIELERKMGKKIAAYPVMDSDWMDMGQLSELEKMRIKLYGE